ncbi:Glyoxylate/hydroxypyruvate reductase B [Arthrobacter agilis]|nr:NAD(P)-dependent oxidoreductase [Arthrobacter agilis]VDR31888.1 Glyoxylate/hydroxypyruvate reductase B [Arthrobacter agilis]
MNASRGPLVDTDALVRTLQAERIGGAALDVYDVEPLPADHILRSLPRPVLTPHIGYITDHTYRVFYPQVVYAILAWLAGSPIRQLG